MDLDDGNLEGNDTKTHGEELCRNDVLDQEHESSEEFEVLRIFYPLQ